MTSAFRQSLAKPSLIRDNWVPVSSDEKKVAPQTSSLPRSLMASGKSGKSRLNPVRTKLAYSFTTTGSASTAFTLVQSVEPALSGEFTAWAGLYDEIVVNGGELFLNVIQTGTSPSTLRGAVAYDPLNNGAYGSVAAAMEGSQSAIFLSQPSLPGSNGFISSPAPVTKDGYYRFKFVCPKGKAGRTSAVTTNFSGDFSATTDSADTYGYLKFYIEAGTNQTVTTAGIVLLDVTLRSRS